MAEGVLTLIGEKKKHEVFDAVKAMLTTLQQDFETELATIDLSKTTYIKVSVTVLGDYERTQD
jgi:hypothetical protein